MASSLLNPLTCGYAKVAAYTIFKKPTAQLLKREPNEGSQKFKARVLQAQHKEFLDIFHDRPNDFKPEYKQFYMSISKLKGLFVRWNKDNSVANKTYQDTFSVQNWGKLSKAKKEQHMLIKCKGCYHHHSQIQASFPVKSKQLIASAKENPFYVADNIPQQKPGKLKDITKNIYNSVNRSFEKSYGLSFAEAQTKVPELKLTRRQDQNERKNERRQNYRKIKTVIEDEWKKPP